MPDDGVPSEQQPVCTATVRGWLAALPGLVAVDDADRVDQLRLLEEVKAATAAAQARVSVDFDASQRRAQHDAGVPARRVGAGIAAQVALARRDSPHRGGRHLGLAKALVGEMPHTLAALTRGEISEWRATLLARETACLSRADRGRGRRGAGRRPRRAGRPRRRRRSSRRPAGSPTGWTRTRSPPAPPPPPPTAG